MAKKAEKGQDQEHHLIAHQDVGDSFGGTYYVEQCAVKLTAQGKKYTDMMLRDKSGSRPVKFWGTIDKMKKGDFVFAAINVEDYMGAPSMIARNIERALPPDDLSDHIPVYEDVDEHAQTFDDLRDELQKLCDDTKDQTCGLLVDEVFRDSKTFTKFATVPGSERPHYGRQGGLMACTVRVAMACKMMAESYGIKSHEKAILLAGAILHRVGGVDAFGFEDCMPCMTRNGRLLGVGNLTLTRVQSALKRAVKNAKETKKPVDMDSIVRTMHLIASTGEAEVQPMTQEALILANARKMDVELVEAIDFIENDLNVDDEFTAWDPKMRRRFYRGQ